MPKPQAVNTAEVFTNGLTINHYELAAHLFDFPILGDDFFLYLAHIDLKCAYKPPFTTVQVRVNLGRHDIDVPHEDAELYVPTEKVVLHPDYRKRNVPDADIGLVLLQQTVQ